MGDADVSQLASAIAADSDFANAGTFCTNIYDATTGGSEAMIGFAIVAQADVGTLGPELPDQATEDSYIKQCAALPNPFSQGYIGPPKV